MLDNDTYIDLVGKYARLYRGKYLDTGNGWTQLIEVYVSPRQGEDARQVDAMRDSIGNLWWIRQEVESLMGAEKILERTKLPDGAHVIGD